MSARYITEEEQDAMHGSMERVVAAAIQIVAHTAPVFVGSRIKELEAALVEAGYGRDIAEERRGMR